MLWGWGRLPGRDHEWLYRVHRPSAGAPAGSRPNRIGSRHQQVDAVVEQRALPPTWTLWSMVQVPQGRGPRAPTGYRGRNGRRRKVAALLMERFTTPTAWVVGAEFGRWPDPRVDRPWVLALTCRSPGRLHSVHPPAGQAVTASEPGRPGSVDSVARSPTAPAVPPHRKSRDLNPVRGGPSRAVKAPLNPA